MVNIDDPPFYIYFATLAPLLDKPLVHLCLRKKSLQLFLQLLANCCTSLSNFCNSWGLTKVLSVNVKVKISVNIDEHRRVAKSCKSGAKIGLINTDKYYRVARVAFIVCVKNKTPLFTPTENLFSYPLHVSAASLQIQRNPAGKSGVTDFSLGVIRV